VKVTGDGCGARLRQVVVVVRSTGMAGLVYFHSGTTSAALPPAAPSGGSKNDTVRVPYLV